MRALAPNLEVMGALPPHLSVSDLDSFVFSSFSGRQAEKVATFSAAFGKDGGFSPHRAASSIYIYIYIFIHPAWSGFAGRA